MNKQPTWEFTCKACGSHYLNVYHVWNIMVGSVSETWQEWGSLEADHSWHFEFKEKMDEKLDDQTQPGDLGEFAENDSSSELSAYAIMNPQSDSGADRFYVNCASCDREIEFGWAEHRRGGGIFPVECSDFSLLKVWPEPRYLDAWQQKGWLQAGEGQR